MTVPDWVTQLAVAALGAVGTACLAVVGWLITLGQRLSKTEYRITSMEAAMQRLEVHQSETAKAMVDSLTALREESRGLVEDMSEAREKALETFVTKADIRDLLVLARARHDP